MCRALQCWCTVYIMYAYTVHVWAYHQFKKNCGLNITQSSLLLISEFQQSGTSSQGKTACDGVSGTLKRIVSRASLQRPYDNQIITPQQLYEFACKEIKGMHFCFTTTDRSTTKKEISWNIALKMHTLSQELKKYMPTNQCQKIVLRSVNSLVAILYMCHWQERVTTAVTLLDNIPTQKYISGYNTADYDGFWWLGCVHETQLECRPVKVNF